MKSVSLRNGKKVSIGLVGAVKASLARLADLDFPLLIELALLCRGPKFVLNEGSAVKLRAMELIETDGQPTEDVRDIILAATEIHVVSMPDDVQLILRDPTIKGPKNVVSMTNAQLYAAARKIEQIYFELIDAYMLDKFKKTTNFGPYPLTGQTEKGIFLQTFLGRPWALLTPWGRWEFIGRGEEVGPNDRRFLKDLFSRVRVQLYSPKTPSSFGPEGPVYSIHFVDEVQLDDPVLRELHGPNWVSYMDASAEWDAFGEEYDRTHAVTA